MIKLTYFLANPVALRRGKAFHFEISQIYHGAPLLLEQKRRTVVDTL